MREQLKNNRKMIIFVALLLVLLAVTFIWVDRKMYNQTLLAEIQVGRVEREKRALLEQIEYLDQLLIMQSLTYSVIFDGTEDELRGSMPSDKKALDDQVMPHEAAEIINILEGHVNESVDFTLKGDDYLLVVHKDLIGGEVRDHVKYVLENPGSIDIYFEREVLPFTANKNMESRLIYHWVKVLKIFCEANVDRDVVIHIIN